MKFCGAGGLMVDSTCGSEEYSPDRQARFVKNFRPLGGGLGSVLAGSFDVHQELIEYTEGKRGVAAIILCHSLQLGREMKSLLGAFFDRLNPLDQMNSATALAGPN
jgi:hypothetical protein